MMFHAPTGRYVVDGERIERAAMNLLYSLAKIRELAGLPLEPYEKQMGALTPACFAQVAIFEVAENIGIDLGATRHTFNKLDLRDKS